MAEDDIKIEGEEPDVEVLDDGQEAASKSEQGTQTKGSEPDGIDQLKANLAAERERNTRLEREKADAEQDRDRRSQEWQQNTVDGRIHQMNSAKEAETAHINILKNRKVQAFQNGDYQAIADIDSEISARHVTIGRLDVGIINEEARKKQLTHPRQEPQRQPQPMTRTDQFIQANRLGAPVAEFIRQNPDFITTDRKIRRLADAHEDAVESGHEENSAGYFDFIKSAMGGKPQALGEAPPAAAPQRRAQPAAPPSRQPISTNGARSTKLTLTRSEADTARQIGLTTPAELAAYARELQRQKQSGMQ